MKGSQVICKLGEEGSHGVTMVFTKLVQKDQLLPAFGPRTPEICSRNTAAGAGAGFRPLKVSPEALKLSPAERVSGQVRGKTG